MALSSDQIKTIEAGQALRLTTHPGDYYLDAKVIVLSKGFAACQVKVTEILDRGEINMTSVDERIVASFAELEILP